MVKFVKKVVVTMMILSVMALTMAGCGNQEEVPAKEETEVSTEAQGETVKSEEEPVAEEAPMEEVAEEEAQAPSAEDLDMFKDTGYPKFEVISEDLHDGVWDSVITNTENGSNVSPQLSWEPIPEATNYVIYMVDTTVEDWIHWKSNNVTETNLPQGWAPEGEYIGPYPPGGTHTYEIYVFALKEPVERAKGAYNNGNMKFVKNCLDLDAVTEGATGNILAYGHTVGTYTKGD